MTLPDFLFEMGSARTAADWPGRCGAAFRGDRGWMAPLVGMTLTFLVGCADTRAPMRGPDAGATDGPDASAVRPPAPDASSECTSLIPCRSALQCVSIPGAICNEALESPRCQRLECAPIGSPCSSEALCSPGEACLMETSERGRCGFDFAACMEACEMVDVVVGGGSTRHFCTEDEVSAVCNRACSAFPNGLWAMECEDLATTIGFSHASCDPFDDMSDAVTVRCGTTRFSYHGF